jgi:feruloyl esterase
MLAKPLLFTTLFVARVFAQPASCEKLAGLSLPHGAITLAQPVAAGEFKPSAGAAAPFRNLPAFCRVAATLVPSKDSDIKIEVWLPASGWNGKFQAVGNGGWSGAINQVALGAAVRRGYAAAGTDTGHAEGGASFALGHPEKLVDFGYRAVHEMTVKAKAVIAAYYGSGPRFSYWNGCSSGGKQGLKEAQRFPEDYDGIIAGAPANYWTHLMAGDLWPAHATLKDAASYIPPSKYPLIHQAVLEACDSLDGLKDGLLEDPGRCKFDPNILLCQGEDAPACLTGPQVEAARKIYGGARNPRTGQEIFPGLAPGSELGWGALAGGPEPFGIPVEHFKYVVFKDPAWDFKTLNFDGDVALADKIDNGLLNATDPNLKDFFDRGGKLLQYHGWNDQLIAPFNSIDYYRSVEEKLGAGRLRDSYRLFMAPGMAHCAGGEGPNTFDMVSIIEQWVEQAKAPDRIIAAHRASDAVDRTRPLCPYPQVAHYKGTGSADDAANFVCQAP